MRYFVDTEFIEDGKTIDLLSIGIVAEDGREFYAQLHYHTHENASHRPPYPKASDWVARNVFPSLQHFHMLGERLCRPRMTEYGSVTDARCAEGECPWRTREQLQTELLRFCAPDKYGKPEFWGYFADYDWVVLCQLFGRMIDLPKGWPMYCRDIKQWCDALGNPRLPEQGKGEHHALADARWNRQAWEFLRDLSAGRGDWPDGDTKYLVQKLSGEPLPDGEPVFVLRGQDALAADIVREYAERYREIATADPRQQDGFRAILRHAAAMEAWPTKKLPD